MADSFYHDGLRSKDASTRERMKAYMEKQLTDLHYQQSGFHFKDKFYAVFFGALVIIMLPFLHIGVFYRLIWVPDKPPIDKYGCGCTCFDTVFRGRYEMPGPGVSYKHIYFNATKETFKIWIATVLFVLLFYESVKYLVALFRRGSVRWSMFLLYVINLYPHYYSWWSFFSYYNEEFYTYFKHHMFFAITEIIATVIVLSLCNAENDVASWKISAIVTINTIHILVSGLDQFISHVIEGHGTTFQNVRNIGLMIPDFLHIVIPVVVFLRWAKKNNIPFFQLCYKEELIMCVVLTTLGTVLGRVM
ncbi:uncharacterized protein [Haliotis asinina]|uniref:uncharacterized protein isoform X1 n=2 Tax=Haliotis asinina TaxID=109174 RepID=UPI003531AC26